MKTSLIYAEIYLVATGLAPRPHVKVKFIIILYFIN